MHTMLLDTFYRAFCLSLLIAVSTAATAHASPAAPQPLNPITCESPSGHYKLDINPSERFGTGPADYRVAKDGTVVWSATLPFTLYEAAIGDNGSVGGYSYSRGPDGMSGPLGVGNFGDFRIVIIDAAGKMVLNESTPRRYSRFQGGGPDIGAMGLVMDSLNYRLVVRVSAPNSDRSIETWKVYRLSTGKVVGEYEPGSLEPDPQRRFILQAKSVAGTPLILIHWWRYDDRADDVGAAFSLVDEQMRPVWQMTLDRDYELPADSAAEELLRDRIRASGAILRADESGKFDLRFVADARRVTFSVEKSSTGKWTVTEVARAPYIDPPLGGDLAAIPERNLEPLPDIVLNGNVATPARVIRDIVTFTFDVQERIAFLRDGIDGAALVLVTQTGDVVRELPLSFSLSGNTRIASIGNNRFIVTDSRTANDAKTRGWFVDWESGAISELEGFDCPLLDGVRGFADGRFVVLTAATGSLYGAKRSLRMYSPDGKVAWTRAWNEMRSMKLPSDPIALAIHGENEIAVYDRNHNAIQAFDRDGKHLRSIQLTEAWDKTHELKGDHRGIEADVDGGFVLQDWERITQFIRIRPDGSVRSRITAKYADGKPVEIQSRINVDPSGRMWIAEEQSILRLDAAGVVDRTLGGTPVPDALVETSQLVRNVDDHLYLLDSPMFTVHIFDREGQRLRTVKLDPVDFGEYPPMNFTVAAAGDFYVLARDPTDSGNGAHAHYSADGKRLELVGLKSSFCYALPTTERFLAIDGDVLHLVDLSGNIVHTIDRCPNGDWLRTGYSAAVAVNGSFAVLSRMQIGADWVETANIWTAQGAPVCTIQLPAALAVNPRFAYDGRRLVASGNAHVVVYDNTGTALFRMRIPDPNGKFAEHIHPILMADGSELVLFDGKTTRLHRFKMPE